MEQGVDNEKTMCLLVDDLEAITEDFKEQHERMKAAYDRFVEALEAAENESVRESVQRVREDKG